MEWAERKNAQSGKIVLAWDGGMGNLKTCGYEKWWPMRMLVGRNTDGSPISAQVYRNMMTGEIHHPMNRDGEAIGWNGEPPPLDPAEKVHLTANELYRRNYDMIRWEGK